MPNQSARVLGRSHGLSATEMNFLLRDEGFLEGSPGLWGLTEKGREFAAEQFHSRGTGGYSHYNPSWETRSWDPTILDQIDISLDRVRQLKDTARAARQHSAASRAKQVADLTELPETIRTSYELRDSTKVALGITAAMATSYGAWKLAPHVKRLWRKRTNRLAQALQHRTELERPSADREQ